MKYKKSSARITLNGINNTSMSWNYKPEHWRWWGYRRGHECMRKINSFTFAQSAWKKSRYIPQNVSVVVGIYIKTKFRFCWQFDTVTDSSRRGACVCVWQWVGRCKQFLVVNYNHPLASVSLNRAYNSTATAATECWLPPPLQQEYRHTYVRVYYIHRWLLWRSLG